MKILLIFNRPPEVHDQDLAKLLKDLIGRGVAVKVCGTCMTRCGIHKNHPCFEGAEKSTMQALSEWVVDSERVLSFWKRPAVKPVRLVQVEHALDTPDLPLRIGQNRLEKQIYFYLNRYFVNFRNGGSLSPMGIHPLPWKGARHGRRPPLSRGTAQGGLQPPAASGPGPARRG